MDINSLSEEERKEIIEYGLTRSKVFIGGILVTLVIGVFFGVFIQSVIFLLVFSSLRRYAGGYHADSENKCYAISFIIIILSFWCIKSIEYDVRTCFLMQAFSLFIILLLSPVENKNRKLEICERKKYGKKTKRTAIILFLLSILLYVFNVDNIIPPIVIAYLLVTILLIAGYIKNNFEKINL